MPRGDGTGPNGKGPRTGRGLGSCSTKSGGTKTKSSVRGFRGGNRRRGRR